MIYSIGDSLSNQQIHDSMYSKINEYPAKYETIFKLKNGKTVLIRPVKPSDMRMVQELHYSLDRQDIFYRYFSYSQNFGQSQMQPLVNINYNTDMVLVAEYNEREKVYIVAMGGFFKKMSPGIGEFILLTHKNWRSLGIARFLLKYLINIARDLNYTRLGGSIYFKNEPMLHIINSGEYKLSMKEIGNEITVFIMDITN